MTRSIRSSRVSVTLAVLACALAGCSSDDGGSAADPLTGGSGTGSSGMGNAGDASGSGLADTVAPASTRLRPTVTPDG